MFVARGTGGERKRSNGGALQTVGFVVVVQLTAMIGWLAARSARDLSWFELGHDARRHTPAMGVFAVVATASLAVFAPLCQRLIGPRGKIVAPLALLAFAPLVVTVALARLDMPVVTSWWGPRLYDISVESALPFYGAGMLGGLFAMLAAGRRWVFFERVLAVTAPIVVGLGMILGMASFARALASVDPGHFVASMALVGVVPPAPRRQDSFAPASSSPRIEAPNGVQVRRLCYGASGAIPFLPPSSRCSVEVTSGEGKATAAESFDVGAFSVLTLRYDAEGGFLVIDEDGRRKRAFNAAGAPMDIPLCAVAHRLGPPRAWVVVAALGLFSAAAALWLARRAERAAAKILRGTPGTADGASWIHVEGDAPLRTPSDASAALGPVVVIPEDAAQPPSSAYRRDRSRRPAAIIAGEKDDLLERLDETASAWRAFAIVGIAMTSAPLVAALLRGLVL